MNWRRIFWLCEYSETTLAHWNIMSSWEMLHSCTHMYALRAVL